MKQWDVYDDEENLIDTVYFCSNCTKEYVLDSLINHDGYDRDIEVYCEQTGENKTYG